MPSSHSSSSHSSSSRSGSSRSSSSRSSSSRSSSSRSTSSRSGSSHSGSRSSSGSSRSSGGQHFGGLFLWNDAKTPSRHSGSSHTSQPATRSHYVRSGESRVIPRTRSNQPKGYVAEQHHNVKPIPHNCLRHNYLYYPLSWTDAETGREYKRGYYDEDGQYYESVVFRRDGQYQDVVCQCEYCDTVTKLDWTEGGPLICPQCGGSMKILSDLDEYTQDPFAQKTRTVDDAGGAAQMDYGKKFKIVCAAFAAATVLMVLLGFLWLRGCSRSSTPEETANGAMTGLSNPELFGTELRLLDSGKGVCTLAQGERYDRKLVWVAEEDSYYDEASGLWVWYNTDVDPALWQYWYEPISGDFGDYGWMEYEDGVWYIEAEQDRWIEVPSDYELSPLWHIEPASLG